MKNTHKMLILSFFFKQPQISNIFSLNLTNEKGKNKSHRKKSRVKKAKEEESKEFCKVKIGVDREMFMISSIINFGSNFYAPGSGHKCFKVAMEKLFLLEHHYLARMLAFFKKKKIEKNTFILTLQATLRTGYKVSTINDRNQQKKKINTEQETLFLHYKPPFLVSQECIN